MNGLRPDLAAIAEIIPQNARVLDIGCGDGALLEYLAATKNVDGRGLELSRNLMTVRMAQQIGMKRVVEVAKEFGVTDQMGAYLPMALGAGETTLLRMTMAYAMLANGALWLNASDRSPSRGSSILPCSIVPTTTCCGGSLPKPMQTSASLTRARFC